MKALVFRYSFPRFAFATILGKINPPAYLGPGSTLSLESIPEPVTLSDDWIIVQTRLCGICGSDIKQVFLDGNFDNPLTAFVSFPQVLGHEAVGVIKEIGPDVKYLQKRQFVAFSWFMFFFIIVLAIFLGYMFGVGDENIAVIIMAAAGGSVFFIYICNAIFIYYYYKSMVYQFKETERAKC